MTAGRHMSCMRKSFSLSTRDTREGFVSFGLKSEETTGVSERRGLSCVEFSGEISSSSGAKDSWRVGECPLYMERKQRTKGEVIHSRQRVSVGRGAKRFITRSERESTID